MRKNIPAPVIAILSTIVADEETHATLDSLFMYAGAPGEPPDRTKYAKALEWLRIVNNTPDVDPLSILGKIIEEYMETDPAPDSCSDDAHIKQRMENRGKLKKKLHEYGLTYITGGIISENVNTSSPSKSLEEIIKRHDVKTISSEFERALKNISSNPPDAVLAACTILESICRIYIEDHDHLELPKKLSLDKIWIIVRKDLGFDPQKIEDQDLQKILTGIISIVNGIGSLRTHAGSAHGVGRTRYNLEPRHARLAVHAAHTIAAFIMESWEKKMHSKA
ncbi:abortive infection family protein [Candidatus Electrothrix sp.]|uniref:abortive infection family protein n=1 Tax=Candidatus Electrothrix sp. TaxID=2170559 RepID=UPI00405633B2